MITDPELAEHWWDVDRAKDHTSAMSARRSSNREMSWCGHKVMT